MVKSKNQESKKAVNGQTVKILTYKRMPLNNLEFSLFNNKPLSRSAHKYAENIYFS